MNKQNKIKCKARTMKGCFAVPHVCKLEKGHKGQHQCGEMLDPSFPLSKPIGRSKRCRFKWGKK